MARANTRKPQVSATAGARPPQTEAGQGASPAAPGTSSARIRKSRTKSTAGKALPAADWRTLDEEALLARRIRDLGLTIEGSPLEPRIRRFHAELEEKGLAFKPPCYLADEWLTPDGMPIIGIPFYLAHPRLTALEKKMMLEAEGETEAWCLKLLRHEAGHAFNYAYRLHARKGWKETFGDIAAPYYHVTYDSKPYSKRFVIHLEDHYAQAHPDEDFAETFAVWATPGSDWRVRYRGWPALKKLEYLNSLMESVGGKAPLVKRAEHPWSAARMASTLQGFYDRKRKYLGSEFPGYYDPGLKRVFALPEDGAQPEKAVHFLRRHRASLLRTASAWAPQRKYDVARLLDKLTARCAHLDLRLRRTPQESLLDLTAFVTAVLVTFRRFNGVHESK